jgi:anti-anti-sigma regulatory factor
MDTTPVLRDAVAEARGDDNAHLVIDLSAVSSMDTTGCTFCLKPFENTTSAAVVIYQP